MLHYTKEGQGQPVVLIHGFPNDSATWDEIAPSLRNKYLVIRPDLPGAGKSAAANGTLTMQMMAATVKEVLDTEGIQKAVIAGHSMGGYTALEFAKLYPEYVLGLSLVHSLASADSDEKKENRRKAIILMQKGSTEQEVFLRGMAQNLFSEEFLRNRPDAVRKVVEQGMKLSGAALAAFYEAIMNRSDKQAILSDFNFPIQWIIGDEDSATPKKDALKQCHLARVNDAVIYSPCGHMSMMEMPERLASDINRFLDYCYSKDN